MNAYSASALESELRQMKGSNFERFLRTELQKAYEQSCAKDDVVSRQSQGRAMHIRELLDRIDKADSATPQQAAHKTRQGAF